MTGARRRTEPGDLPGRLRRHLRSRPELVPPGEAAVVAVSGGPDSLALADLLARMGPGGPGPARLVAAHFDHGLRPESAEEARRVVTWCRRRGIPWLAAGPSRPLPPDPAACRRARYDFLRRAADQAGAGRILTAHHGDDQVETVLFRILRGSGLRGLRGLPELRGRVARPLLPFRSEELRAYAVARGLPFHDDPANRDPAFARTRIRHRLLPELEARHGDVREKLREVAALAGGAEASMEHVAERALGACRMPWAEDGGTGALRLSRRRVRRLDGELRARVLRRAARDRGVRLTRGGTRSALRFVEDAGSGARVDLGDGLRLGRDFDILWMGREPGAPGEDRPVEVRLPGRGAGRARIGGALYRVAWGREPPGPQAGGGLARRLHGRPGGGARRLRVRGWEPGDRIRLAAGTRKLKDVFVDRRVPRSLRGRVPVLADDDGRVLWVPGLCGEAGADGAAPAADREGWWVIIGREDRQEAHAS